MLINYMPYKQIMLHRSASNIPIW